MEAVPNNDDIGQNKSAYLDDFKQFPILDVGSWTASSDSCNRVLADLDGFW